MAVKMNLSSSFPSSMCSTPRAATAWLPLELHHYIIDYLWDDLPTLASCSLTCYAWLPSARSHMFRTLIINSPGKHRRADQMLIAHPHLACFVRELRIDSTWLILHRTFLELFALVPRLPQLAHLRVRHWLPLDNYFPPQAPLSSPRQQMPMPGMFANVRELTLHTIYLNVYELARLLHALPGLHALHFRSVMFAEVTSLRVHPTTVAPPAPTMELRALTWHHSTDFPLMWLLHGLPKLPLRYLSLGWNGAQMSHFVSPAIGEKKVLQEMIRETIRRAGPTLEHLELYGRYPSEEVEQIDLGLGHCKRLRVLMLTDHYDFEGAPTAEDLVWMGHVIRQLNSRALEGVEIGLTWEEDPAPPDALRMALAPLDNALAELASDRPGLVVTLTVCRGHRGRTAIAAGSRVRLCVRSHPEGRQRANGQYQVRMPHEFVEEDEDEVPILEDEIDENLPLPQRHERWFP
ncbi:uncharacterized protein B0H18DRAFT_1047314 [Fomitopsis serialis]|uniref:uncharacterized protein n=1 Tax=Fomitopsis serialis TaxID=139415 RepID=UPI00200835EB|nr:uncharacterized protein B0H18DRAFT_1047314 [Neoantrodia serialis]KAH9913862.1 hypothetical protein B0H18DRAFT_1047314 [Neoantrodia serialis]